LWPTKAQFAHGAYIVFPLVVLLFAACYWRKPKPSDPDAEASEKERSRIPLEVEGIGAFPLAVGGGIIGGTGDYPLPMDKSW
jgi:hypothetical protein